MMRNSKSYYCYMMASQKNGTLYVGITSDLIKRVYEHKTGLSGFTGKYEVDRLVWFEVHPDVNEAILREKRLKLWKREWKINLIQKENPQWIDLYPSLLGADNTQEALNFESYRGCLPSQA